MDNELCGTCLSYDPDKETQGFGECIVSGCQVSEGQQSCIDWRNSGGPDYERKERLLRNGD